LAAYPSTSARLGAGDQSLNTVPKEQAENYWRAANRFRVRRGQVTDEQRESEVAALAHKLETPEQLANKIIATMEAAGLLKGMLAEQGGEGAQRQRLARDVDHFLEGLL
jgi:hypothetical protein